ncbi:MAG: hypothetical protein AAGA24_04375 [Pseudomonadota bacterium]
MSLTAIAILMLPLSQSASTDILREEELRLANCLERAINAPLEAYEDSLAWLSGGNRPRARYCNAIALLALEEYEEGAARLESLANAPDAIAIGDRARFMAQAGNAWLTANYPEAAITALSEALKLERDDPNLYKDRAAAYLALSRWVEGVDDLNSALALYPEDAESLRMRAKAHLETANYAAAQADIEESLSYNSTNLDTLVLRGEIREAIRLNGER